MNGAGGLQVAATHDRIRVRSDYFATACGAIGITRSADIFEIIVLASKVCVIEHCLQSLPAPSASARASDPGRLRRAVLVSTSTLVALAVMLFGVPAKAG